MNKTVSDKQCTILWDVDDLNIFYVDSNIVSSVLADIYTEYGKFAKMTITQGNIHKYIGITIDYYFPGKVIFFIAY